MANLSLLDASTRMETNKKKKFMKPDKAKNKLEKAKQADQKPPRSAKEVRKGLYGSEE